MKNHNHHKSDSSSAGGGLNMGIIVEARNEYTTQLTNVLKPIVYAGLLSMYEGALNESDTENMILYYFQKELKNIPKWNNEVIKEETKRVLEDCSYFNELVTAVFLSNVRILTSVKIGGRVNKKFQLVVPTNENFIHQVYISVGKAVYGNPYLFSLMKLDGNITNNIHDVFDVIESSVADTIRRMLPIKNILEAYVVETTGGDDSGSESESDHEEQELDGSVEEDDGGVVPSASSDKSEEEEVDKMEEAFPPSASQHHDDDNTPMDSLFEKVDEEVAPLKEISLGGDAPQHAMPVQHIAEEDAPPPSPTPPQTKKTTFFDDVTDDDHRP